MTFNITPYPNHSMILSLISRLGLCKGRRKKKSHLYCIFLPAGLRLRITELQLQLQDIFASRGKDMSLWSCPFTAPLSKCFSRTRSFSVQGQPAVLAQNHFHAHSHHVSRGNVQNQAEHLTQQWHCSLVLVKDNLHSLLSGRNTIEG